MSAIFDSNMAMVAQQNGLKGVVINGFVLDLPALQALTGFGSNPNRGMQQLGQRSIPLTIGGIIISPGSWIYADSVSGIICNSDLYCHTKWHSSLFTSFTFDYITLLITLHF